MTMKAIICLCKSPTAPSFDHQIARAKDMAKWIDWDPTYRGKDRVCHSLKVALNRCYKSRLSLICYSLVSLAGTEDDTVHALDKYFEFEQFIKRHHISVYVCDVGQNLDSPTCKFAITTQIAALVCMKEQFKIYKTCPVCNRSA